MEGQVGRTLAETELLGRRWQMPTEHGSDQHVTNRK